MKHIDDIRTLVKTLQASSKFHALVIQSPPGWAKSSTIDLVLRELGIQFETLGSYTTPLFLYNSLCKYSDQTIVLDDCAGLFTDSLAMAVLKAATWPSTGTDGARRVTWNSTSERVNQPSAVFTGKVILLTNTFPAGQTNDAFLSRALFLHLRFERDQVATMLREAAQMPNYFENTVAATEVAEYIVTSLQTRDHCKINLRTLQMGYEIAKTNAENWRQILERLLPEVSPQALAQELANNGTSVEEQAKEFMRTTGLSRRTFFNYRATNSQDLEGAI